MRKLVIANRSCGGIGKSSAIKAVWQLLKKNCNKPDVEVWQDDIMAVFDINGVKIGISSQGDPDSCMEKNMEDFERNAPRTHAACSRKSALQGLSRDRHCSRWSQGLQNKRH